MSNDVDVQEIETQSNYTLPPMVEKYLRVVTGGPARRVSPTNQQRDVDQRLIQGHLQPYKQSPIIDNSFRFNGGLDDESALTKCGGCHFDWTTSVHHVPVDPYMFRSDVNMARFVHSVESHRCVSAGHSTKKEHFLFDNNENSLAKHCTNSIHRISSVGSPNVLV